MVRTGWVGYGMDGYVTNWIGMAVRVGNGKYRLDREW